MKVQAILLAAYGFANVLLYSALLPLWEGFDEPFHFGYVQYLANGQGLPDPRNSFLSRETGSSLEIAPGSDSVHRNLPEVKTYADFFSSSASQRAAIRAQLNEIPPDWRRQNSHFLNYEAQHAPLAYILLALPERTLAGMPLLRRVLLLRILGGMGGALLLYFGAERVFTELGMPDGYKSASLFCIFSCQMTWATIAHVANDWLAVPLSVWLLAVTIRYWKNPHLRTAAAAGAVLSLGLLTKAYFVAFAPVPVILCLANRRLKDLCLLSAIVLMVAGPWYARNILRYGSLTATQQSRSGIGASAVIRAAPALDWPRLVWERAGSALWTGNNTFMTFSRGTLTATIAVSLMALIFWARSRHGSAEWITVLHCGFFAAALGYDAVALFIGSGGVAFGPSPWYSQVLLAPVLGLAFLGCSRSSRPGKAAAAAIVVLFGYMLIATYAVKLIPIYGGYEGRTSLSALIGLYSGRLSVLVENLNLTALAPAGVLFGLTAVVTMLALALMVMLVRSIE